VVYGLIGGVITISIGILTLKEYEGAEKSVWHWLAALVPSIIILLTPINMIHHLGLRVFLTEKLAIFIVFDGIALVQLGLAVFMFRGLIFKREAGKLEMPRVGFAILNTTFGSIVSHTTPYVMSHYNVLCNKKWLKFPQG